MEIVSVKFQEDILKKIDKSIEDHNFNSRTEFIREAVRDKLENLSRDELIAEFLKFHGKAKRQTTDEEREMLKEQAAEKFLKEKGWKV